MNKAVEEYKKGNKPCFVSDAGDNPTAGGVGILFTYYYYFFFFAIVWTKER